MLRFIHINLKQNKIYEVFNIFERHFKIYKDQVICFEHRLSYLEYKWREELFK